MHFRVHPNQLAELTRELTAQPFLSPLLSDKKARWESQLVKAVAVIPCNVHKANFIEFCHLQIQVNMSP